MHKLSLGGIFLGFSENTQIGFFMWFSVAHPESFRHDHL
jgi:hypothetical protein